LALCDHGFKEEITSLIFIKRHSRGCGLGSTLEVWTFDHRVERNLRIETRKTKKAAFREFSGEAALDGV